MSQIEGGIPQLINNQWFLKKTGEGFSLVNPDNEGRPRFYEIKVDPQNPEPPIYEVAKNGERGKTVGTVVLTTALGPDEDIKFLSEYEIPAGLGPCKPTKRARRASATNPNQPESKQSTILGYTKNAFTEGSVKILWDKREGDLQKEQQEFVSPQELIHDGHFLAAIALLGLNKIPEKELIGLFTNLRGDRRRRPKTEIDWLSQIENKISSSPTWEIKIDSQDQFKKAKEKETGVQIRWGWHGVVKPDGTIVRFRAPDVVLPREKKKIARVPVLIEGEDGEIYVGVNPNGRILDFSELPEKVREKYKDVVGWGPEFNPNSQRIVGGVKGGVVVVKKKDIGGLREKEGLKLVELTKYPSESSPENPADFVGLAAIASALLGVRANATRFEELLAKAI